MRETRKLLQYNFLPKAPAAKATRVPSLIIKKTEGIFSGTCARWGESDENMEGVRQVEGRDFLSR